MIQRIDIFTDGACTGNPGQGGWSVVIRLKDRMYELSGTHENTTNNRMELLAVINGLAEVCSEASQVYVHTDSMYVKKGIEQWIKKWKVNGWKTSTKNPVRNQDLWIRLDALVQKYDVKFFWVRGHSGHVENEYADRLARKHKRLRDQDL